MKCDTITHSTISRNILTYTSALFRNIRRNIGSKGIQVITSDRQSYDSGADGVGCNVV